MAERLVIIEALDQWPEHPEPDTIYEVRIVPRPGHRCPECWHVCAPDESVSGGSE